MQRIVVGIDGSEHSQKALRWAVEEARVRGASLEVVHAWNVPSVCSYPYTGMPLEPKSLEDAARTTLDTSVDRVDTTGLAHPVERILSIGAPAETLLASSKGADLVVVGSRGHGGFAGLLLGSVSQQVEHHAHCPVVIVPPKH
jgi:nucleotide-binding universal stress UspA family protein